MVVMMATNLTARITKIERKRRQRRPGHRRGCMVAYDGDPDLPNATPGLWNVNGELMTPHAARRQARGKQLIIVQYVDELDED